MSSLSPRRSNWKIVVPLRYSSHFPESSSFVSCLLDSYLYFHLFYLFLFLQVLKVVFFSFQMRFNLCFNRHILVYLLSKWKHLWFLFWISSHLLTYDVTSVSYISFSMQQELKSFTNFVWLINIHSWTTLSCMFTVMSGWSLD